MSVELIENPSWKIVDRALADTTLQVGLAGPPGVGKTYRAFLAGKRLKQKRIEKLQFHAEYSPAEAMGMYVPAGTKFAWEPGPVDLCYREGGLLILDEIAEASGPMKTYLLGLLDRGPGGTISYVGRTFRQAAGYHVIATMNGYPDQGYLPEALLDRFDAWFLMYTPSPEQMALLDPDLRELCAFAYAEASDPMVGPPITFRMFMGYQKMRKILPNQQALLAAVYGNKQLAQNLREIMILDQQNSPDTEAPDEEEDEEEEDDNEE